MNYNTEVDYIYSLTSSVISKVNDAIRIREAHPSAHGEYIYEGSYAKSLRDKLTSFHDTLFNFKNDILPLLVNNRVPEEINLLLAMYFKIIERLMYFLLYREGGVKLETLDRIFSIFGSMVHHIISFFELKKKEPDFTQAYMTTVIDLRVLLENELQLVLSDDISKGGVNRIDTEIDKVKQALRVELNEVSMSYSKGRDELLSSIEIYQQRINSLSESAEELIKQSGHDVDKVKSDIAAQINEVKKMKSAAEMCLKVANDALGRSNQVGMAAAFKSRHDELESPMRNWMILFIAALIALIVLGCVLINSDYSSDISSVLKFSAKLVIAFPLIWGAWFSAKQYSHTSQLREDYAYKVAVAMTYHGYKDEAASVNNEMSGKLLENIIAQFSDNPVRLYRNENDVSILETMLKNDKFSDLMNSANKIKE
ncbi:hypothetical protein [Aeromonas caviae]|uniref:hypothetical protein n=1 Tax=Aeromonas caviae TaxID=648 RepID=UPI00191D56E0|nr:hypothetical protein [Aeromonas caviae]MBL0517714.1 hypothetical protein [Aeromonas caviae]